MMIPFHFGVHTFTVVHNVAILSFKVCYLHNSYENFFLSSYEVAKNDIFKQIISTCMQEKKYYLFFDTITLKTNLGSAAILPMRDGSFINR